ncbi:MAG: winged helix-turn-helix domain-containing protein [Methanosarcinales archaeon]
MEFPVGTEFLLDKEKSSFRIVFGDSPRVKVLDFLLTFREFDYSLTEIAENANIGLATLNRLLPRLIKLGIVKETRKIGGTKLYKLNQENELVKTLIEMDNNISEIFINEELETQNILKKKVSLK